jgi:ABC-type multidrug transport system ATPase subunit
MVNPTQVLELKNISKQYGRKPILDRISFSLHGGQVVGILGPNGAGKTTLLKIICGLTRPSSGEVILSGVARAQIATIFEDQRFLGQLSGLKNMTLFLNSIGEKEFSLEKNFEQYGLAESKHVKYKVYSSGMKKRMDLMSIFVSGKRLFLLDEPTNGLDIDGLIAFNHQVTALKNEGKSFVVCSHHALELEKISDLFLLIDNGTVVSQMGKEDLVRNFNSLENAYRSIIRNQETNNFRQV